MKYFVYNTLLDYRFKFVLHLNFQIKYTTKYLKSSKWMEMGADQNRTTIYAYTFVKFIFVFNSSANF